MSEGCGLNVWKDNIFIAWEATLAKKEKKLYKDKFNQDYFIFQCSFMYFDLGASYSGLLDCWVSIHNVGLKLTL